MNSQSLNMKIAPNSFIDYINREHPYLFGLFEFGQTIEMVIMTLYNLGIIDITDHYKPSFLIYLQILYVRITLQSIYKSYVKFMKKKIVEVEEIKVDEVRNPEPVEKVEEDVIEYNYV